MTMLHFQTGGLVVMSNCFGAGSSQVNMLQGPDTLLDSFFDDNKDEGCCTAPSETGLGLAAHFWVSSGAVLRSTTAPF